MCIHTYVYIYIYAHTYIHTYIYMEPRGSGGSQAGPHRQPGQVFEVPVREMKRTPHLLGECVCVCVCIYIYIYIERERER